jgi:DNA-binding response OmpR family regulator
MNPRILIVDDEELVLASWKYALESAGYFARTALIGTSNFNL